MAQRGVDDVLAEARAEIAAGRLPDVVGLRARLAGDADALARLDRVLAVHRARTRIARTVSDTSKVSDTLRTRPTIKADMDVRRVGDSRLEWDAVPAVASWEIRISTRADARSDYVVQETFEIAEPSVELPLADRPLRVHVLGRTRDGRLARRAVVSGLTRLSWTDRWQRR